MPMNRVCEMTGAEFPLFAFSHCRDVVAAVSKAGGFGVFGATRFSPDQLEEELAWIDAHVDGAPYGVDVLVPEVVDASVRELHEELGIDTWESCLAPLTFASHSYDDFHLLMPLFACRRWQGTPQSRENQTLKWVRPQDLRAYPMPPADIPLIPILRDWL